MFGSSKRIVNVKEWMSVLRGKGIVIVIIF